MKLENIPPVVWQDLTEAHDDDSGKAALFCAERTREEVFAAWMQWHGIINWAGTVWAVVLHMTRQSHTEQLQAMVGQDVTLDKYLRHALRRIEMLAHQDRVGSRAKAKPRT